MATKQTVESVFRGLSRTTGVVWKVEWQARSRTKGRVNMEKVTGYPQPQTPWLARAQLIEWARAYRLGWMDSHRKYYPIIVVGLRLVNRLVTSGDWLPHSREKLILLSEIEEWQANIKEEENYPPEEGG